MRRTAVVLSCALQVACGAPSLPAAPRPSAAPPSSATTAAVPPPLASVTAPPAEPAPVAVDNLSGTLDAVSLKAPCDLARYYRGTVGESPLSLLLSRAGDKLSGFEAYDAGFGDLAVTGTVAADGTVSLSEIEDGAAIATLTGSCASDSGVLSGAWTQGQLTRPFVLRPREANATALVERRKRIGTLIEDAPSCHWDVRSPAVFGLGDRARESRINNALRVRFGRETEMERLVTACPAGSDNHVLGWYAIEANESGLLSVVENGYSYLGPAVHGDFTAAAAAISIDVPTGKALALGDVVTSSLALRPLVSSCMSLLAEKIGGDPWWWERAIQGVPADGDEPSSIREPSILVLPDGLAVLIRGQPTATAAYELVGPVIRWSALLRASVLAPRSPVARLWANATALAPNEPACTRVFRPKWSAGDHID